MRIQDSIRFHQGQQHVNAQGVLFDLDGAGYIFDTATVFPPESQRGIIHDSTSGDWTLLGDKPSINFRGATGDSQDWERAGGALTGVRGISGGLEESNNLRGAVSISDSDTFSDVVFETVESDGDYQVVATVNQVSGDSVPIEARIVDISDRTASGFRLNLAAPAGVGESVTIAWILIR